MSKQPLYTVYRPKTFDDVTEQDIIKTILTQQLESGEIQHAYLFVGGAGTGKTTCAKIFANEINKHKGSPIEFDAASNSGVEDVRDILREAKLKSLDSEYKVFIIDECHALSDKAWQAFLKILEEPPAKTIFIFCTTDPQKIPKTIISRVQRYTFNRISQKGIVRRLDYILAKEVEEGNIPTGDHQDLDAVEYLAKIADGGMRDAITLMDKCLAYSSDLTVANIIKVLGTVDYKVMEKLTEAVISHDRQECIDIIGKIHADGKDLKRFMRDYMNFLLDICKYDITRSFDYINIPQTEAEWLNEFEDSWYETVDAMLSPMVKLIDRIKYDTNPKSMIEVSMLIMMEEVVK